MLGLGQAAPTDNRIAVAWSQVMGETRNTEAAWNFNWGNIIATSVWLGAWQTLPGLPPEEPQDYRAYTTAEEGAADYWKQIARSDKRRDGRILAAFDAADTDAAARELKAAGYYGTTVERYQLGLRSQLAVYRKLFGPSLAKRVGLATVVCAIAAAVAYYFTGR